MATPGCSLQLASNVGDTFSDADASDILLVASDCVITGAMLLGFATTNGSAPFKSAIRVDATSLRTTGDLYGPAFSNVGATTYTSSLRNAGPASFGGEVSINHGLIGNGFSNLFGRTFATAMEMGTALVAGTLTTGAILGSSFSNVSGVTYMSNLSGASLTGCIVPYANLTDAPPLSPFQMSGSNAYIAARSNVGFGTLNPICALDVVGDLHASGSVYAKSFVMVGGGARGGQTGQAGGTSLDPNQSVFALGSPSSAPAPSTPKSTTTVTMHQQTPSIKSIGMRKNLIVNGDMRVDQRTLGDVTLANVAGTYVIDRMVVDVIGAAGSILVRRDTQQTRSLPTMASFSTCLALTVTAPNAYPAGGDHACLTQRIEGKNIADLGWGTPYAMPVTVSFWCLYVSTDSGTTPVTFAISIRNGDSSNTAARRSIVSSFSVISGVWSQVSISFVGDTCGTWTSDEGLGATISIVLACETASPTQSQPQAQANAQPQSQPNTQMHTNTWLDGNLMATPNLTNFMATVGTQLFITGIQMEQGTMATSFEASTYADELFACQRHLYVIKGGWQTLMCVGVGGYIGTAFISLPVSQRAIPTLTTLGPSDGFGVLQHDQGQVYRLSSARVWAPNYSTRDLAIVTSWPSRSDASAPVFQAGQVVSMYLRPGTTLVVSAEL